MDLHRRVGVHGLIAPNSFSVTLAPADVDRFANFVDALSRELADAAREHARSEGYAFVGPVDVQIYEGTRLRAGRFTIVAEMVEGPEDLPSAELVLPDGRRVAVGAESVVIGRLPECAVVLSDPNVSRRHAEVRHTGGTVVVTDLGSTNGTKVNGVTVREQQLTSGDEITVGSTTLVFELS
jgi:threonine dehydratase